MYSELALANFCSVQMLFHKDVEQLANWSLKQEKCHFAHEHEHATSLCKLPEFPVAPKSCSFLTFKHSVLALSRVSGCYLIMNYDRRSVGQTGSGHFSPVTGYHALEDKSLVLDVARFKYPSHWVDLPSLYQSMKTIDEQSGLTRGFIIACRSTEMFADICRITPDYALIKEMTQYFSSQDIKDQFKLIVSLKSDDRVFGFLQFLKHSHPKLVDLLTLLVIQLTYSLETKRNNVGTTLHNLLDRMVEAHPEFQRSKYTEKDLDDYLILTISKDYLPSGYQKLLALMYQLFYNQLLPQNGGSETEKALQGWNSYVFL